MQRLVLTSILAFALLVPVAGCGGDSGGGASAEGTWTLDTAAFKSAMEATFAKELEGKTGPEAEMMKKFTAPMLEKFSQASMQVEIRADGTWTGTSNFPGDSGELEKEVSTGTWAREGAEITMTTTKRGDKAVEAGDDVVTATIEGDTIRVAGSGGKDPEMLLRRK